MEFDLTIVEPYPLERLSDDYTFKSLKTPGLNILAEAFKSYNSGDNIYELNISELVDELFIGNDGRIYRVNISNPDEIKLERIVDLSNIDPYTVEEVAAPDKEIAMSLAEYQAYLRKYLRKTEKLLHYTRLSARLHSESVQDAVDTVQTKRIEFQEAKGESVEIAGILTVAISFVVFELGGAAFILNKLLEASKSLSSSKLIGNLLNAISIFAGKHSAGGAQSNLQLLKNNISELETKIRQVGKEIDRRTSPYLTHEMILKRPSDLGKLILKSRDMKSDLESNILDEQKMIAEISKIGREQLSKITGSIADGVKNNLGLTRDLSKAAGVEAIKQIKSSSDRFNKGEKNSGFVPVDVYFKTFIQNQFDEPLLLIERIDQLIRDLQLDLENNGLANAEIHQDFINSYPTPENLDNMLESFEKILGADFSYTQGKWRQTLEYELMAWSLTLSGRFNEGNSVELAKDVENFINVIPDLMGKNGVQFTEKLFGSTQFIDMKLSDNLLHYLADRFSIERSEIDESFLFPTNYLRKKVFSVLFANYQQITKAIELVNKNEQNQGVYRIQEQIIK